MCDCQCLALCSITKEKPVDYCRVCTRRLNAGHLQVVLTYTVCIFLLTHLLRSERKSKQNKELVTERFGVSASELSPHKVSRKYSKYISGYEARHRHSVFEREINFMN